VSCPAYDCWTIDFKFRSVFLLQHFELCPVVNKDTPEKNNIKIVRSLIINSYCTWIRTVKNCKQLG
jgi:hypothetical protein